MLQAGWFFNTHQQLGLLAGLDMVSYLKPESIPYPGMAAYLFPVQGNLAEITGAVEA